ncbi:MAG: nitrilase-related carbon-nitrogen hydrolase, partial [Acidimicrobiales bacterium]
MVLRVALAQLDPVVGDLAGNVERIVGALRRAEAEGADLCCFPEMAVTGYPPEDLLLKSGFVADNLAALGDVAAATTGSCAVVVGFVEALELRPAGGTGSPGEGGAGPPAGAESRSPGPSPPAGKREGLPAVPGPMEAAAPTVAGASPGGWRGQRVPTRLANAAAVCAGGAVVGVYRKRLLPNYSVFDEQRWFVPGSQPPVLYQVGGVRVGVSICEDIWADGGPVLELARAGAEVVVNINASPYSRGRRAERLSMLGARVAEIGCPVAYVNQVGGQDQLVFDGASLVVAADGTLLAAGAQFRQDLVVAEVPVVARRSPSATVTEVPVGARPAPPPLRPRPVAQPLEEAAEVYEALVLGTRDYLAKNGFSGVVIGLSGGIDSSLVAAIAADALGPEHVHGVAMPSRYSSAGSVSDARLLAERLGIELRVLPIEPA